MTELLREVVRHVLREVMTGERTRMADGLVRLLRDFFVKGKKDPSGLASRMMRRPDGHVEFDVPGFKELLGSNVRFVVMVNPGLKSHASRKNVMMYDLGNEGDPEIADDRRSYDFQLFAEKSKLWALSDEELAVGVADKLLNEPESFRARVFHELGHLIPLRKQSNAFARKAHKPSEENWLELDAAKLDRWHDYYNRYGDDPGAFKRRYPTPQSFVDYLVSGVNDKRRHWSGQSMDKKARQSIKDALSVYDDLSNNRG